MQTYTCPFCRFNFSEADKQWDSAKDFGECPQCSEPLRNFPVLTKRETLPPLRISPARTNQQEETPPAQQPWDGAAALKRATGWRLWVFMALIALTMRFLGLLGGLVFWGLWSLSTFLINKYKTRKLLPGTPNIDTPPKKSDQQVVDHKPAVTREPAWDRQFSDVSTGTREQATPSGASEAITSTQPTANQVAHIPVPSELSQNTSEAQEERLYEQIAQELETNTVDKGLWTKVYAQAGGDAQQTRALYIKARFARLLTGYANARQYWEKAAIQGDSIAQAALGTLYYGGQGVTQDYAKARQWYEQAAAQGNADAQAKLGQLYANGLGVRRDYAKALEWSEKAAAQGNALAQHDLGLMYFIGAGVPQNFVQAHMWLILAAANLVAPAAQKAAVDRRDETALCMTPAQLAEAQRLAREWKPIKEARS